MLLILAFLYFSRSAIHAAPVTVLLDGFKSSEPLSPVQCFCPDQQRSIWNILWSCLATVFACTWVSVHPNMPTPGENSRRIVLRRLKIMFWGIIAPEVILYWAMRQWKSAQRLASLYHEQGWTKTHAYFLQMGGFTLFEGKESRGVLHPQMMERLLGEGKIELPTISEEEIRDRSKGDGLSKALVIMQTSWFMTQCIARRAQGLDITELELVTSAFAVLNGVMYFFWWNKPLDVRCSVPLYLLDEPKKPESPAGPANEIHNSHSSAKPFCRSIQPTIFAHLQKAYQKFKSFFQIIPTKLSAISVKDLVTSPWTVMKAIFSGLGPLLNERNVVIDEGQAGAPIFYAGDIDENEMFLLALLASVVALIFGAIHCAGWVFIFPTHTELLIWRVCSAVITSSPLVMTLLGAFVFLAQHDIAVPNTINKTPGFLTFYPTIASIPIYIIARLLLLVEAFLALRNLPPGAYEVVKWVTFIPHI